MLSSCVQGCRTLARDFPCSWTSLIPHSLIACVALCANAMGCEIVKLQVVIKYSWAQMCFTKIGAIRPATAIDSGLSPEYSLHKIRCNCQSNH